MISGHIFSYLFTGMIIAAIYDVWIDPKMGVELSVKNRIIMALIMIIGWLPILLYVFYLGVTGKEPK